MCENKFSNMIVDVLAAAVRNSKPQLFNESVRLLDVATTPDVAQGVTRVGRLEIHVKMLPQADSEVIHCSQPFILFVLSRRILSYRTYTPSH